ncbi:TrmB family transcriptional regulator [Halapricum salinum]|uniref:TrmB family transcriptional regulator n=1 Tax=Halapricum salinum TaxID=1457250 RepID=A0A4D6HFS3_9EURY|nr:helix-turn-helix domain-containing protein [Halapricum salinum]QCC52375.1 TrmB family transcriptional regulator [Halapricum salinum]
MHDLSTDPQPVELLQQLGLKEYEAKSFVALSRVEHGTAKDISDLSEVPRTRVYDAVRVLESKGLVEVQHSSPQVFRAVPVDEAVETLEAEYRERFESLRTELRGLEPADHTDGEQIAHEVWSLSGTAAIANRVTASIEAATDEILMIIGNEEIFTEELSAALEQAQKSGVEIILGAITPELQTTIRSRLPQAEVFVTGLEWLRGLPEVEDTTEIGRLLLIDRSKILVSTYYENHDEAPAREVAVFGTGFHNGVVTIVRRILAIGFSQQPLSGE